MKLLLLLASVFALLTAYSQTDTISWYYQNGNIASIQPYDGTHFAGDDYQYYLTGELKSHSKYSLKTKSTFTTIFYKNGVVQAEYKTDSLGTNSSKIYYENGNLQQYVKQIKNGTYRKDGYQNGKTKDIIITKNGSLIGCIAYQQKDSSFGENICYCKNKRVSWKKDHWEDQTGNIINADFYYSLIQYDTLGKKVLHLTQNGYQKKTKAKVSNQWKITREIDSANVIIPCQEPSNAINTASKMPIQEGYPLLREPNPPRDTTIRKYTLEQLTDSTIHWDILTRSYDSLGQAISIYSNYGEIKLQKENLSSDKFISYGNSENNISFQINRTNQLKARVLSTSGYFFYATESEVDVVWK